MEDKTVDIILATYNGEKYLDEQIASLVNQTYRAIRILVTDDGSTDATSLVVQKWQQKDPRIFWCPNEQNKGYVKNFLDAVGRSESSYVMLCDQDDIWNEDKVFRTMQKMQQLEDGEKPVMVFADAMNFDSATGNDLGSFHKNSHLNTKKVDNAHLFMENKVIGCTVMVNDPVKKYLQQLPDEIRVHDWWLALICSHFGTIGYISEPLLRYRQHENNMIGGNRYGSYLKQRLLALREQREVLRATVRQAQAFYDCFSGEMTELQKQTAKQFAGLYDVNWFLRRIRVIRHGFWKSGLGRNIGLLLLL